MTCHGWHFLSADGCIAYGGKKVVPGEWIVHAGPVRLCESGLHWSARALDALRYAPGPVACRIEASGETFEAGDKAVSSERRVVWMLTADDGGRVLSAFARQCAATVLPLWDGPVPQCVVDWLVNGRGDASNVLNNILIGRRHKGAPPGVTHAHWAAWYSARTSSGTGSLTASATMAARHSISASLNALGIAWFSGAYDVDAGPSRTQETARAVRDTLNSLLEAWLLAAHEGRWDEITVTVPLTRGDR